MKPQWRGFRSPIAASIERYLAHKRALGCRSGSPSENSVSSGSPKRAAMESELSASPT
jgi:hypothetical protein